MRFYTQQDVIKHKLAEEARIRRASAIQALSQLAQEDGRPTSSAPMAAASPKINGLASPQPQRSPASASSTHDDQR